MDERIELARRAIKLFNEHAPSLLAGAPVPEEMRELQADDVVIVPLRAVLETIEFTGPTAMDEFWAGNREVWSHLRADVHEVRVEGAGVLINTTMHGTGRAGGVASEIPVAYAAFATDDNKLARWETHVSVEAAIASLHRRAKVERLERARLYFVCDGLPNGEAPDRLLDAALDGGADLIQLREPAPRCDEELIAMAEPFRRAADQHDALFIINDRPDLVAATGADGVHVGQDDLPVAEARAQAGPEVIVGLSTHAEEQVRAADQARGDARPDQISVGPIWETPTKEGRPATGLGLIEFASANADLPWFAIGGIDTTNVAEVAAAGAERIVVVRAIRDAEDPAAAARELRTALDAVPGAAA